MSLTEHEAERLRVVVTMLAAVARGDGAFSRDPHEHAENVIEESKIAATRAIETLGETFPILCDDVALALAGSGLEGEAGDEPITHGINCPKAFHDSRRGGYLHGGDDDTPYPVDGVRYCGRCHEALP